MLFLKQQNSMGHHPWKRGCIREINLLQKLKSVALWFQLPEKKLGRAWRVASYLTLLVLYSGSICKHNTATSACEGINTSKCVCITEKQNGYRSLSERRMSAPDACCQTCFGHTQHDLTHFSGAGCADRSDCSSNCSRSHKWRGVTWLPVPACVWSLSCSWDHGSFLMSGLF